MVFVRGAEQAEFVSRLRGVSSDRVLLVPVDVGKRSAMSMVANQLGEVIVDPSCVHGRGVWRREIPLNR